MYNGFWTGRVEIIVLFILSRKFYYETNVMKYRSKESVNLMNYSVMQGMWTSQSHCQEKECKILLMKKGNYKTKFRYFEVNSPDQSDFASKIQPWISVGNLLRAGGLLESHPTPTLTELWIYINETEKENELDWMEVGFRSDEVLYSQNKVSETGDTRLDWNYIGIEIRWKIRSKASRNSSFSSELHWPISSE